MLLHIQRKPWDLYIVIGYTIALCAALLAVGSGNFFTVGLVFFGPGYVLIAALFPGDNDLDWIERIALSFGLSIVVLPLLGLLLNFTPLGIRFSPTVMMIALVTIGVGYAAHSRPMRLPAAQRLSLTIGLGVPNWKVYGLFDRRPCLEHRRREHYSCLRCTPPSSN